MTDSIVPVPGATGATTSQGRVADDARLRRAAEQFEGMFVRQMFAAMRATVPPDGVLSGGAGEELFTSLLDEHVADSAPSRWSRSVADQLVARIRSQAGASGENTR